jgi:hypothetical protein
VSNTKMGNNLFLSKSHFMRGLQCYKSLFLHKRHPELRDELSDSQEAIFITGQNVGILAQGLFPGGIEITFDELTLREQLEMTRAEIAKGTKVLYEAALMHDDVFIKADILRRGPSGWELYEVKSSTELKDHYAYDIAIQYHVARGAGLPVSKACLVHIDNQYTRQGEIDVRGLFAVQDLTDAVSGIEDVVVEEIGKLREVLSSGMPETVIGKHCIDPYECDFWGHCWQHIPEVSVFSLRGRGIKSFDYYNEGKVRLESLPIDELPSHAQMQIRAHLNKETYIDKGAIREFLETLWYPLCHLDFETVNPAIPLFEGTRPYQQIPFQYSLHVQETEEAEPVHYEILAEPGQDPRSHLISKLVSEIPDGSCVLAYNMGFEKGILNSLKDYFPNHAKTIDEILANMRDLIVPFRSRAYYSWLLQGSYSLKEVLPALVPELSYDCMDIIDGGMASLSYLRMCETEDADERKRLRLALLEYCKLDTLGMVKILGKLRDML